MKYLKDITKKDTNLLVSFGFQLTEKIDGSSFEFGIDSEGYYSTKKGFIKCRSIEDWPDRYWATGYRSAHRMGQALLLSKYNSDLTDIKITCELLLSRRQNTIEYNISNPTVIVISQTKNILTNETFSFPITELKTVNDSVVRETRLVEWNVVLLENTQLTLPIRLKKHYSSYATNSDAMYEPIKKDVTNKTPAYQTGKIAKNLLDKLPKFVSSRTPKPLFGPTEGFVIKLSNDSSYKLLVDQEFKQANYFAYWVKFVVVGGRRPKKPSFLSRTKNWNLEKRLERLEQLKSKYLRNVDKLYRKYGDYEVRYSDDLHTRMLAMFEDTKRTLEEEHGR